MMSNAQYSSHPVQVDAGTHSSSFTQNQNTLLESVYSESRKSAISLLNGQFDFMKNCSFATLINDIP